MAARTAYQAVDAFVSPLQRTVSFVTRDVLIASGRELSDRPHLLTFRGGGPARLRSDRKLSLRVDHRFMVMEDPGSWKIPEDSAPGR